jgi:hypothetical protein
MIVNMSFLAVILLLVGSAVVVTVGQTRVIVLVRMPERTVVPFHDRYASMVMGDVVSDRDYESGQGECAQAPFPVCGLGQVSCHNPAGSQAPVRV